LEKGKGASEKCSRTFFYFWLVRSKGSPREEEGGGAAADTETTGGEFYGCPSIMKEWGRPFVSQERQFREDQ
jgi:hypothetical protein